MPRRRSHLKNKGNPQPRPKKYIGPRADIDWEDRPVRKIICSIPKSRSEMAVAGLNLFFLISKEWRLTREEQRILLGGPGRSRFFSLTKISHGNDVRISNDELDRLGYIRGIYTALHALYQPESHCAWLRNMSGLPVDAFYRPWGSTSPLHYMLTGNLKALSDIYGYLNLECNGL